MLKRFNIFEWLNILTHWETWNIWFGSFIITNTHYHKVMWVCENIPAQPTLFDVCYSLTMYKILEINASIFQQYYNHSYSLRKPTHRIWVLSSLPKLINIKWYWFEMHFFSTNIIHFMLLFHNIMKYNMYEFQHF